MAAIDAFKAPKLANKNTATDEIVDEDEVLIDAESLPLSTLEKDSTMQVDQGEGSTDDKPVFKALKAKQMAVSIYVDMIIYKYD
jgi:hypothetical protein